MGKKEMSIGISVKILDLAEDLGKAYATQMFGIERVEATAQKMASIVYGRILNGYRSGPATRRTHEKEEE